MRGSAEPAPSLLTARSQEVPLGAVLDGCSHAEVYRDAWKGGSAPALWAQPVQLGAAVQGTGTERSEIGVC